MTLWYNKTAEMLQVIREFTEEKEEMLSPFAAKSRLSEGREQPEMPCPIRTVYQRDRDRILHSNSFRRLKHKTQVFIAPLDDHFVTRLTHTLEVSQIARTISRALNLNEDLTEAIALGHDMGHTPFGHIGEKVLDDVYPQGFRHNEQSLRVVEKLENNGRGLNLTFEVRDGILNHSKSGRDISVADWVPVATLEGEVVRLSDLVAYINHDIDDAIRAGVITEGSLPLSAASVLGINRHERINNLVTDIVASSWDVRGGNGMGQKPHIAMSDNVVRAAQQMSDFLFERVYNLSLAQEQVANASEAVSRLYYYYLAHEEEMPPEYRLSADDAARRAVDYVAGMTDQYAARLAETISS
jgi:dGTPase